MNTIRLAIPANLPRLVEINNQAITSRTATANTIPFLVKARRGWFYTHAHDSYPIYVCEADNQVVGYLSLSPYRDCPALARTVEVSFYVDYACHGEGIGSDLMQYAITESPRLGKKVLVAILHEWNISSIKLLEKFGFERWGFLPEVAEFSGGLCGHLYNGRKI